MNMKKITIEINGQTAEIAQKNCARVDEAIALRALLLRVKENLPPKGGNADVLTVQSALVPLDKLGEAASAPPPPAET